MDRRFVDHRPLLGDDTDPAVERMIVSLWRAMAPSTKLARMATASSAVRVLTRAGARERHRTDADQRSDFAESMLGRTLAARAYASPDHAPKDGDVMDHLEVVLRVVRALEACGVRYVLGGAIASSVSGEPRATVAVDLMVDLPPAAIPCLVAGLAGDFYVEEEALQRAVRMRSRANVVHLPTATKVDLFVMGATPIEHVQMARRRLIRLDLPAAELYVYTPEDILLQKLRWFRMAGETSERQWRDIAGIVAVQGERLDASYLRSSASAIGVSDLLERALATRR